MHQILIVDEEEHLLWALEKNLLPERDDIKVMTARGGDEGLRLLKEEAIDVLICDIKMPGKVDGFQLILRAKEVAPDARVVIMTAFGTNRIQNLAERIGITHYIEKPFNISELRNVVLELLNAKEGFQGVLSDLELTDIIQMLCLAKRTALLHLKHKEHRGKIVFERGDVCHAEFDDVEGDEAVYKMLALRQGDIYMQSDFFNTKRTISIGWQDLLLEGVRRADEGRVEDEDSSVIEDSDEITLGMPPRLVSEVTDDYAELGDEASRPFFTDEELAEIESVGNELTGTANGFDRVKDSGLRNLIDLHDNATRRSGELNAEAVLAEVEALEVSPAVGIGEEVSQPMPGRPTDSSDFPAQSRAPELRRPMLRDSAPFASPKSASALYDAPPKPATVVAQDVSGGRIDPPRVPRSFEQPPAPKMPAGPAPTTLDRSNAPTMMLQASGLLSSRNVLEDFARECQGLSVTGIFSFEDGLALDFYTTPQARYEPDVLAAFFRDVAACADKTAASVHPNGWFNELQIQFQGELILMRRVWNTPYVHIAAMDAHVRLGLAIVLMRRCGERLSECFNR